MMLIITVAKSKSAPRCGASTEEQWAQKKLHDRCKSLTHDGKLVVTDRKTGLTAYQIDCGDLNRSRTGEYVRWA